LLVAVLVSGGRSGVSVQQQAIATGLSTLINIFILPITPIAMTFLYYDVRVRTEGLDLALQALGPDARPESVRPPIPTSLLVSEDYGKMLILAVVSIGILLVFGSAAMSLLNTVAPGLGGFVR
ncbi:MAG: hypothetical protein U0670_23795, partial [Anaerolineae bacterium]